MVKAQFPTKLANYTEQLITQKNEFQIAIVMQIAVGVDKIGEWCSNSNIFVLLTSDYRDEESMTSDAFLKMRLGPAEQHPLDDNCLPGTRVKILQEARDWLNDCKSPKNILWIVGAPGVGKSTIATTLARELADKPSFLAKAPSFAKFFCKRDNLELQDPRRIWRTLATTSQRMVEQLV